MCGFAGYIDRRGVDEEVLCRMIDRLVHRGPDAQNTWCDSERGVGFVHARLAIQDLSAEGNQPMISPSGRYVIVFNGEIYNHLDIRKEVEPVSWRGHSDTETLLAAFDRWGVNTTLKKSIGMFAFAVWDAKERKLVLGRDRFGEKPLYYGWLQDVFYFASELKALRRHPKFKGSVDRVALGSFMRHGYVPAPKSIYEGISKLTPGTVLEVGCVPGELCPDPFWQFSQMAHKGLDEPFVGGKEEAVEALEEILTRSVSSQQISDVPVGAFLSGGIDSSTVVSLMQSLSGTPINTFTIGFAEKRFNEAGYAKQVAEHLGTNHSEWTITPKDAIDMIPKLPEIYDEPFADSSQIPTALVSRLAKRHVKVCLSGDGGDELFYGYYRYFCTKKITRLPSAARQSLAVLLRMVPLGVFDGLNRMGDKFMPGISGMAMVGDKLHKLAKIMEPRFPGEVYNQLLSVWCREERVVLGAVCGSGHDARWSEFADLRTLENKMMALDSTTYLVDDILCKVDRAAMSVSLEARVPFLDHRVAEFAWSLPLSLKAGQDGGKLIVKNLLRRYLPTELIDRPKMGFGLPIEEWVCGPLRDWVEDLISETRLEQDGFLDASLIRKKWNEHIERKRNWHSQLWNVLMFQAWLAET